jgi:hypothetical protein
MQDDVGALNTTCTWNSEEPTVWRGEREREILEAVGQGFRLTGWLSNDLRPYEGRNVENVGALSDMRV